MRHTTVQPEPSGRSDYLSGDGIQAHRRQAFQHSRTSLGVAGHWIHLGAVAAPLLIGEMVKDPESRWRALRLASVGAALASEAVWTLRLMKEREREQESDVLDARHCPAR